MNDCTEKEKKQVTLNGLQVKEPCRVCYLIDKRTKDRLSCVTKGNPVLNASLFVDIAVNSLLDDLENGNAQLVINMKKE